MTENEAIEKIKDLSDMGVQSYRDAKKMAISALKEIQRYREIGTVEECREAVEKQKPKKPILINYKDYADKIDNAEFLEGSWCCPNCKTVMRSGGYCKRCGQAISWEESEE